MDVAFVARFREADRVLEHVDESTAGVIFRHQKIPLSEGYCQKVVNGELPELIPDTSLLPAAQEIPETHTIPICRIPDDCIDSKRYPLFMARAVLKELIESLQSTQGVKPC